MSDRPLPADCDHPEESLGPLPYRAGRPPRADEWECGVCGMWQVQEEPKYKRRKVKDAESFPSDLFETSYPSLPPTHSPIRGTGYLDPTPTVISEVNQLVSEGKLHSMDVSMDHASAMESIGDFFRFIRPEPPTVVITANNVLPEAALDVMRVMYDLARGRGSRLVWEMSRKMLYVLRQRATYPQPWDPPAPPVMFGGEIRALDGMRNAITLRVR